MMEAKMTHYDKVLRHLKEYGEIDSWTAITEYGNTRLSAYILLLRKDGYEIESEVICGKNRFGEKTHFTRYKLKGEIK